MDEQNKPVLLLVEDQTHTRSRIERDLEQQYRQNYQVVSAGSTGEALDTLARFKLRDIPVALVIVDCDLAGSSGTDLLVKTGELFPQAKRILMAEYDQRQAVIRSFNRLALDNYLLKPFENAQEDLFPVIDDLLDDWMMHYLPRKEIRIVGYRWSAQAHLLKNFLARNLIPYRWLEIEHSPEARGLVEAAGLEERRLPVVFFPDGTQLVQPGIEQLAQKVGLQQRAESRFYDLVVVGGGPAGLSAAVYGASEGFDTLLIEAEAPGGQAGASAHIDNYLGFPAGLSGSELTRRAVAQAERFGVEILTPQRATGIRLRGDYRIVQLADGGEVGCFAVLIATGVSYHRLKVPGEEKLSGAGVYYGTVETEAVSCAGKEVFILGGGNSAGQAAMYLARFARSITMVTMAGSLGEFMSYYLVDQIESTRNIHVRVHSTVSELFGENHLEGLTLENLATRQKETVPASALFIFIGASPRTDWLGGLLARDEQGYILTGPDVVQAGRNERYLALNRDPYFLESSIPGIFTAGDTRHGSVKRIASSVGEGAMAVTLCHQYMTTI